MNNFKFVAGTSLLAAAVWLTWHALGSKPGFDTTQAMPSSERHAAIVPTVTGGSRATPHPADHAGHPQAGHPTQATSREEIIEKLQDEAVTYDPAQLLVIRPYLMDTDPTIRAAAVNAMVVLGDASAAPMLRDAAKLLASPDEAKMYERKAAYLELPPLTSEDLAPRIDPPATE